MEKFEYTGVDLAELLPRIPDSIKNDLPFGLVKLDTNGTILEYNMAEGEIAGVDAQWAIGKNFFDEVALCTKTPAFYGRFVEGVKKGFMNSVFEYNFDHRSNFTRVRVHMVTVPDHKGQKQIMLMVQRVAKPTIVDAFAPSANSGHPSNPVPNIPTEDKHSIQTIVTAVIAALQANTSQQAASAAPQLAVRKPIQDIVQL